MLEACSTTEPLRSAVQRREIFQNSIIMRHNCKRNIEMTPLCKVEVTLPRVLGSEEVHRGGGVVDEQAGVQPS